MNKMDMKMRLLLIVFVAGLLVSCGKEKESTKVVARVGDSEMTVEDLNARVPKSLRNSVSRSQYLDMVTTWVEREALYHEAIKANLQEHPEFKRRIEDAKKQILATMVLKSVKMEDKKPSASEIQAFYNKNRKNFGRPDSRYDMNLIVSGPKAANSAWAIRSKIQREGFQKTWDELRMIPGRSKKELSHVKEEDLPDCLKATLIETKAGTATVPIRCPEGLIIVHLKAKKLKGSPLPLESVRGSIISQIRAQKKQEASRKFIESAMGKVPIETFPELIPGIKTSQR